MPVFRIEFGFVPQKSESPRRLDLTQVIESVLRDHCSCCLDNDDEVLSVRDALVKELQERGLV